MKYLTAFLCAAAISTLAWNNRGLADRGAQTWEYKFIWVNCLPGGKYTWFEDLTRKLPDETSAFAKAQELGAHGWELVSVVTFTESRTMKWEQRAAMQTGYIDNSAYAYAPYTSAVQYVFRRAR